MKHALVALALGIAVCVITYMGLTHYDQYTVRRESNNRRAQSIAEEFARYRDQQYSLQKVHTAELETLRAECEKGAKLYDSLAATTKAKTPAPECGTAEVE